MSDSWKDIIVEAMGYTDVHGMARAATLLRQAEDDLWKKCISRAKKEHGKEIEAAVATLRKEWNGGVEISNAAVKDVVAKVLQSHGCYPYPELVCGLLGENPYQIRHHIPSFVETKETTQPE